MWLGDNTPKVSVGWLHLVLASSFSIKKAHYEEILAPCKGGKVSFLKQTCCLVSFHDLRPSELAPSHFAPHL
jgi:hypothetical protein